MNNNEFIFNMSKKLDVPYNVAEKNEQAIIECIIEELQKGGKVKLVDFGEFVVVKRAARKGYQPFYKKIIDIPSHDEAVFKYGKAFRELLNKED